MTRILPALVAGLLLAGCSTIGKPEEPKTASAEEMYREAQQELSEGNYASAVKRFEALSARYPYGRYAQQAELEIAYANYKDQEPTLALAAVDRFIKQYPAHPSVDYAYYLKGLINFLEDRTLFAAISRQDLSERDPRAARESFEAFRDLITRFPNSRYAEDARDRLAFLVTALADHELHVARYYYKRGAYLAAANRAKVVLENYSHTDRVERALVMMSAAYDKLGMNELRDDSRRVLEKNYPNSKLTAEIVFADESWWKLW
ncbi:outer membrane protein assembly factor BamD [Chitinimonas lacunae]|uniref:Outer membrane protein assembly factor BamD n=1 Tax=Chitinimonas lacunae TaxID=1963018 RepID=A0ABV8MQB6_9NEIS